MIYGNNGVKHFIFLEVLVHAGMYGEDIAQKAKKIFNLDNTYNSLLWIHTIAHALDRLYCGFTHDKKGSKITRKNKEVWSDILKSLSIFARKRGISDQEMYNQAFSEVFKIDYGYDSDGYSNEECADMRRNGYSCTRIKGVPKEEIAHFMSADNITNCNEQDCLPFDKKYYEWVIKNKLL